MGEAFLGHSVIITGAYVFLAHLLARFLKHFPGNFLGGFCIPCACMHVVWFDGTLILSIFCESQEVTVYCISWG